MPISRAATQRAWSTAFCTDSRRMSFSSFCRQGKQATSPRAEIFGSEVRRLASTRMPFSICRPASEAKCTLGITPIPKTIRSAGSLRPSEVSTLLTLPLSPSIRVRPWRKSKVTPHPSWDLRNSWDISVETALAIGRSPSSRTCTLAPSAAATAANSKPMKPAPTTTTLRAIFASGARASASCLVLMPNTPSRSAPGTGNGRLCAPVARTRWS
ncbi:hypothetical protein D3C81_1483740 [compost metagenome]